MSFVGPVTQASAAGSCARTTSRSSTDPGEGDPASRGDAARAARASRSASSCCRRRATRCPRSSRGPRPTCSSSAEGQIVHVRVEPARASARPRRPSSAPCASPPRPTTPCGRRSSSPPRPTTKPVKGERLATSQSIPLRFLENILLQLRHAGLVESRRGADGGYRLARPAAEVTLADVIRAIDGPLAGVSGAAPGDARTSRRRGAAARGLGRRPRLAARRARAGHAGRRRRRRAARPTCATLVADEDAWVPH